MTKSILEPSQAYTLRGVRDALGLSRHAVIKLVELGFVEPTRGPGRAYRFTFRDLVLLRSAHELRAARIPTRQILRSLKRLKDTLPADAPLGSLRIKAVGDRITVREGHAEWEPDTGQLVMDLRIASDKGSVTLMSLHPSRQSVAVASDPDALFAHAETLEESDGAAAEAAYRQVLSVAPDHAHAYLNLGFILCEAQRCEEAVKLYDEAILHCAQDPLVHYNRAVALEALKRIPEALASYERSLALQPDLADAHQNAALLYAQAGHPQMAIRHFSAYRRLRSRQER